MSRLVSTLPVKINCSTFCSTITNPTIWEGTMGCEAMMTKLLSLSTLEARLHHRLLKAFSNVLCRRPLQMTLHSGALFLRPHRTTRFRSRPAASLLSLHIKHSTHVFSPLTLRSIMTRTWDILCPRQLPCRPMPFQLQWEVCHTLIMINGRTEWRRASSLPTITCKLSSIATINNSIHLSSYITVANGVQL